jgi:hypothetical protein
MSREEPKQYAMELKLAAVRRVPGRLAHPSSRDPGGATPAQLC